MMIATVVMAFIENKEQHKHECLEEKDVEEEKEYEVSWWKRRKEEIKKIKQPRWRLRRR